MRTYGPIASLISRCLSECEIHSFFLVGVLRCNGLKRDQNPVLRMKPRQPKIPARALTDTDIQNLPNNVAAEWEKPDYLLRAQRSFLKKSFLTSTTMITLRKTAVRATQSHCCNPTVVREVSIYSGLVTVQMEVIGGGLPMPIYSFTRPYSLFQQYCEVKIIYHC